MVLESTMICVDNSDFMRNGDFVPTRLQAQQDAVNLICHTKTRSNPENNVGLMTLTSGDVLMTLTTDVGRILSKLHQVQPKGNLSLISGIRIAHLALKHRQGRNHRMRIVAFVGSPIAEDDKDLTKLAKKLKKEKVNVDVVDFGEENANGEKLTNFISTINGKEGTSSHLVTVTSGPALSDALVSSPVVVGEDGAGSVPAMGGGGFEFGVDPNEDPELALALRVSMEEQRARQEAEARRAATESAQDGTAPPSAATNEEQLLEEAMAMSVTPSGQQEQVDYASLSEEQQLALAMQMSLAPEGESPAPMETDDAADEKDEDYSEVLTDPAFLESVLSNLPGVDPQSDAIRSAMGSLARKDDDKDEGKKEEKK